MYSGTENVSFYSDKANLNIHFLAINLSPNTDLFSDTDLKIHNTSLNGTNGTAWLKIVNDNKIIHRPPVKEKRKVNKEDFT